MLFAYQLCGIAGQRHVGMIVTGLRLLVSDTTPLRTVFAKGGCS